MPNINDFFTKLRKISGKYNKTTYHKYYKTIINEIT